VSEYFYSADVVRVTFVVGVAVSMLFYERTQLTTGGSIVPPYLALGLQAPGAVLLTVAGGYLTYVAVNHGIARRRILYGSRKFQVEILVGLAFVVSALLVRALSEQLSATTVTVTAIGFLIPGIIAHDMSRQGPTKTVVAIAGSTAILGLILTLYLLATQLAGIDRDPVPATDGVLGFADESLLIAIVSSVLIQIVLFAYVGLRTGGFVSAAYLAALVPRWGDMLLLLVAAVATWAVVARLLMPRLMLFGRRKLECMVLVGAVLSWTGELAVRWATNDRYDPGGLLVIMTLMVPALIANDAERQGWEKTAWGVVLATLGVYGITSVLEVFLDAAEFSLRL